MADRGDGGVVLVRAERDGPGTGRAGKRRHPIDVERTGGLTGDHHPRPIDEEVRRILDEAIEKVRHILDIRRGALEALTKRLIEVESIDATELKRIIEETSPGPLVVPGTEAALKLAAADPGETSAAAGSKEKSG